MLKDAFAYVGTAIANAMLDEATRGKMLVKAAYEIAQAARRVLSGNDIMLAAVANDVSQPANSELLEGGVGNDWVVGSASGWLMGGADADTIVGGGATDIVQGDTFDVGTSGGIGGSTLSTNGLQIHLDFDATKHKHNLYWTYTENGQTNMAPRLGRH